MGSHVAGFSSWFAAAMTAAVVVAFVLGGSRICTVLLQPDAFPANTADARDEPPQPSMLGVNARTGFGNNEKVPFYMYDGQVFQPDLCVNDSFSDLPRGGYWCMATEWARLAAMHPWRVHDAATAQLFVIPFDLCASQASKRACHNQGHVQRVEAVVAAINSSQWFQKNGGRDHLWVMPHNKLPAAMIGKRAWGVGHRSATFLNYPRNRLIENMTIGRYLSYHLTLRDTTRVGFQARQQDWLREEEKWGCTVVLPIVTHKALWAPDDYTFQQWSSRRNFMFFRGKGGLGGGCFMATAEKARMKAVFLGEQNLSWPGNVIMTNDHASTTERYRTEILDAKYCLVFACDDPQTSRYFEALAAGCIPVLINDAWRVAVAPFASRINYDSFTISVPEMAWTADPAAAAHLIYNRPLGEQRAMHKALMSSRHELLWRHNRSNVATQVLLAARNCM